MSPPDLNQPLILANGRSCPNRIAKAAMDSSLADAQQAPGSRLVRLYQRWADGGAGLLITGNVMIDRRALASPGSVVLDSARHLDAFGRWAMACRSRGALAWLQLNHPGRQMLTALGQPGFAPSGISVDATDTGMQFVTPQPMTEAQIQEVIARFANSARLAEAAGFDGVQILAGQGHLLSQFLSAHTNRRQDRWGGSLENRARLLLDTVRAVRGAVRPDFCVAVNLNVSDFCPGGFGTDDAGWVIQQLNPLGLAALELTGGSYESPAMLGHTADGQSLPDEVYFLDPARRLLPQARMPVMLTGGIRRRNVAQSLLDQGFALAGLATALAIQPALASEWLQGHTTEIGRWPLPWPGSRLSSVAELLRMVDHLGNLGAGKRRSQPPAPTLALLNGQIKLRQLSDRYKRELARSRQAGAI